jgi:hypothetical protein
VRTIVCCLFFSHILLVAAEPVSAVVIGGSVLRNPPQFQLNSFLVGLGGSWQEAYPFQVVPGDAWLPERLDVPLYHYEGMAGSSAMFSIWSDVSGHPGSPLATFSVSDITTEQRVYCLAPSYVACPLQGDTTYWLVGWNAGAGQVNWNMDESIGDFNRAYRVNGGDWVAQSHLCNMSAFAVEGSSVPEPSGIILLGMGAIGLLAYAWQRRFVQSSGWGSATLAEKASP